MYLTLSCYIYTQHAIRFQLPLPEALSQIIWQLYRDSINELRSFPNFAILVFFFYDMHGYTGCLDKLSHIINVELVVWWLERVATELFAGTGLSWLRRRRLDDDVRGSSNWHRPPTSSDASRPQRYPPCRTPYQPTEGSSERLAGRAVQQEVGSEVEVE